MKMPWAGKTGLSKAAALLAVVFLVSLGLCGANFISMFALGTMRTASQSRASGVLVVTGIVEMVGIAVSLGGLFVVAILAITLNVGKTKPKVDE